MLATDLNFGIPDVDLTWTCGGTVNPSCFAGHQLVVLFLPMDAKEAAAELASYDWLADEFAGIDAWYLVVGTGPAPPAHEGPIALDREDAAWAAFNKLAKLQLDRQNGAAFLFTRGGSLHRVWGGVGHATEVVAELQTRG